MADNEISKLTEKVPEDLLKDDSITVYLVDGEDVISQFSVATQLYNPFDFDASRFLPNVEPMDLQKFFSVTRELIADAQKREGIVVQTNTANGRVSPRAIP